MLPQAFVQVHSICLAADVQWCSSGVRSLWNRCGSIPSVETFLAAPSYHNTTGYGWATGVRLVLPSVEAGHFELSWLMVHQSRWVLMRSTQATLLWVCYERAPLLAVFASCRHWIKALKQLSHLNILLKLADEWEALCKEDKKYFLKMQ